MDFNVEYNAESVYVETLNEFYRFALILKILLHMKHHY